MRALLSESVALCCVPSPPVTLASLPLACSDSDTASTQTVITQTPDSGVDLELGFADSEVSPKVSEEIPVVEINEEVRTAKKKKYKEQIDIISNEEVVIDE